jgi:nitrite reductase/ring-hydroxylating ferredoxin subunit
MTSLHVICAAEELPEGTHSVFEVAGRQIGVFNVGGRFFALPNVCFHQNGPLCRGLVTGTFGADAATDWKPEWRLDGEIVVCPWHAMEFHIETGRCIAYPHRKLPTYPVTVRDGQVTVQI